MVCARINVSSLHSLECLPRFGCTLLTLCYAFIQTKNSKRAKYCVRLKYFGNAFASFAWDKNMDDTSKHSNERFYGDQWTPGNASVVATIRESLGEHCKGFDKEKHPIVYQSGRTDRNVSGAGQIVQIFRDAKDHLERRYIDEREEEDVFTAFTSCIFTPLSFIISTNRSTPRLATARNPPRSLQMRQSVHMNANLHGTHSRDTSTDASSLHRRRELTIVATYMQKRPDPQK